MPKASHRHKTNKKKTKIKNEKPQSITKLIESADVAMEMSDFSKALTYYTNASDAIRYILETNNEKEISTLLLAKVLGKKGEARIALGEDELALEDYLEGIHLLGEDTEENRKDVNRRGILSDLYLYLAQMREGEEALNTYQKGIEQLMHIVEGISEDVTDENDDKLVAVTRKKICSVYCSMAELYLTDLCYSPEAEHQCENLLHQASQNDIENTAPDALQLKANLRLSQNKPLEAANYMLEVWERVKVGCTSLSSIVGISLEEEGEEEAIELQNVDQVNALPNFEFRCQSAKLLFECASILLSPESKTEINDANIPNKCLESSILILGSLLAENDEVIEIWFFLGSAFASLKQDEMAHFYLEKTLEMLMKVKGDLENGDLEDVCEKIESVQDKLKDLDVGMEE